MLVFTVAHVLYDRFEKEKSNTIFIDFYDKNGNNHSINATFEKISVGEKLEPYKVYWSENYDYVKKENDNGIYFYTMGENGWKIYQYMNWENQNLIKMFMVGDILHQCK